MTLCARIRGMAKVDSQFKEGLLASGRWPDFVRRRNEFRKAGMTPSVANSKAVAEFADSPPVARAASPARPRKVVESEPDDVDAGTDIGTYMSDFEGKETNVLNQVLWVARYMDVLDVPKSLCPDPAAWSLLMACRESPAMKADFWTKMYAKAIPSKIKEDDGEDDGKFDGKEQVDLCQVLLDASGASPKEGL